MENASKALIIAGAILIAILLISVGILVMNSVNKPIDEVQGESDSQAAQMFNSKFTIYAGKDKSVQDVKSLCMAVDASNASDKKHEITIRGYIYKDNPIDGRSVEFYTGNGFISKMHTDKKFTIEILYPYKDGTFMRVVPVLRPTNGYNHSINLSDGNDLKSFWGNRYPNVELGYIAMIEILEQ